MPEHRVLAEQEHHPQREGRIVLSPYPYRHALRGTMAMEKLLEKAVSEASKLPESEQEALGAWLLAEIESERRWSDLFERPGAVMERMADEAWMSTPVV